MGVRQARRSRSTDSRRSRSAPARDGTFAIRAAAGVKVERFGDAAGIGVLPLDAVNRMTAAGDRPTIAITAGEPAGIGPELVRDARGAPSRAAVRRAARRRRRPRAARASARRASALAPHYADFDPASFAPAGGVVEVWHQPLAAPVTPGHPDPDQRAQRARDAASAPPMPARPARSPRSSPRRCRRACMHGRRHPVLRATPSSSPQRTHTPRVVMLLVGGARRAAARRARHHAPAARSDVPAAITRDAVERDARHRRRRARARSSASPRRASRCAASIRTPARAATSGARRSTSSRRRSPRRARRASTSTGPLPADTVFVPGHRAALRRDRRDVPRPGPAGAQGGELRPRRQRDARPAVHPHVGRPRHGARPRRRRRAARGAPIRAACSRPSSSRSSSRRAPLSARPRMRRARDAPGPRRAQALRPELPRRPALRRADRRRDRAAARRQPRRDRARASPR